MRIPEAVCFVLGAAVSACSSPGDNASGAAPEYLREDPSSSLPFADAVRVGNMLYLSGQIGILGDTLVPGGIQPETRQTLRNIQAVLERNGSGLDRVVRCLVMVADIDEWPAMNEVYVTFFPEHLPARSAIGANGLALGAQVEIECTATLEP